jgi:hypothetical protein
MIAGSFYSREEIGFCLCPNASVGLRVCGTLALSNDPVEGKPLLGAFFGKRICTTVAVPFKQSSRCGAAWLDGGTLYASSTYTSLISSFHV